MLPVRMRENTSRLIAINTRITRPAKPTGFRLFVLAIAEDKQLLLLELM